MNPTVHYAEDQRVMVSRGPLIVTITGDVELTVEDLERSSELVHEVASHHGKIAVLSVLQHGIRPPPLSMVPKIVELTRRGDRLGPQVTVLLGVRPGTMLALRATEIFARNIGWRVPIFTDLELGARRLVEGFPTLGVGDVLRLYEAGANKMLIRGSAPQPRR